MVRERDIESYLVAQVLCNGGIVRKVKWLGVNGAPDRIVFLNNSVHFVELKAPGKRPQKHQLDEHRRLQEQGVYVWVIDDHSGVDFFIETVIHGC